MQLNLLVNTIAQHITLSEENRKIISSRFRIKEVKKKELLLQEGHIAKDVAFVLSGCLRSYSVDEKLSASGKVIDNLYFPCNFLI